MLGVYIFATSLTNLEDEIFLKGGRVCNSPKNLAMILFIKNLGIVILNFIFGFSAVFTVLLYLIL